MLKYFNALDDQITLGSYSHDDDTISVTKVLSHINEDYIAEWANNLGFRGKSYRNTLKMYADEGTLVHSEIEQFLKGGANSMYELLGKPMGFLSFINWYRDLVEMEIFVEPLMMEASMTGTFFSGTVDAVMNIGGQIHIVDYKTSNTISYKHFIQLSVYRYMLMKLKGLEADYLTILQLDKNYAKYRQYSISVVENEELLKTLFDVFTNTYNSMIGVRHLKTIKFNNFIVRSKEK